MMRVAPPSPWLSVDQTVLSVDGGLSLAEMKTRRQAMIDYILALYHEDGYFYAFLRGTPMDPRLGLYPSMSDIDNFYYALQTLDALDTIDWSACKATLESLYNDDPGSYFYQLINSSAGSGPGVFTCNDALHIFPEFGLEHLLKYDTMIEYIAGLQLPSGGFVEWYSEVFEYADLIVTHFALEALYLMDGLDAIDIDAATDFVLSCYTDDGGFSGRPSQDSLLDFVPLGLWSLRILGADDHIRHDDTLDYLLQHWDNSSGHTITESLRKTRRFLMCMENLTALSYVDSEKIVDWVFACQTTRNGAFLPFPDAPLSSERFVWLECALDILDMCGHLDALEEEIYVIEEPEYTIPQWYLDLIEEEFGTSPGGWAFPNIDIIGGLVAAGPVIIIGLVLSLPAIHLILQNRTERKARREARKKRR